MAATVTTPGLSRSFSAVTPPDRAVWGLKETCQHHCVGIPMPRDTSVGPTLSRVVFQRNREGA